MNSVLIGVVTCARDKAWLQAAHDTWMKRVPPEIDIKVADASILPEGVVDSYETLPHKTKALAWYAFSSGYRFLLKIDVDTYLRPDLLQVPPASDYTGRLRGKSSPEYVPEGVENVCEYVSGGAYWLCRRALEIIARAELTKDPAEDRWVGNTLFKFGIRAGSTPRFIAPTHVPAIDYLKSGLNVAVMQMRRENDEEASLRELLAAHQGQFPPPPLPAGMDPRHFPAGSLLRSQMRRR